MSYFELIVFLLFTAIGFGLWLLQARSTHRWFKLTGAKYEIQPSFSPIFLGCFAWFSLFLCVLCLASNHATPRWIWPLVIGLVALLFGLDGFVHELHTRRSRLMVVSYLLSLVALLISVFFALGAIRDYHAHHPGRNTTASNITKSHTERLTCASAIAEHANPNTDAAHLGDDETYIKEHNCAPDDTVAKFVINADPADPYHVILDASSSTGQGKGTPDFTYRVNWGDSSASEPKAEPNPVQEHKYAVDSLPTPRIILTVTDKYNRASQFSQEIDVPYGGPDCYGSWIFSTDSPPQYVAAEKFPAVQRAASGDELNSAVDDWISSIEVYPASLKRALNDYGVGDYTNVNLAGVGGCPKPSIVKAVDTLKDNVLKTINADRAAAAPAPSPTVTPHSPVNPATPSPSTSPDERRDRNAQAPAGSAVPAPTAAHAATAVPAPTSRPCPDGFYC